MQNISKPLITPAQLILSLILFLCMTAAFADPSAGIGNFLSKVGEEDFSANVIRKTFGNAFVDSIGEIGAAESGNILGQMFSIFNTALLAVAMFYFGYQSVSSVAATAEEGSFMGQRFSTVWVPIRFTIGVVSLVPMFSGFGGAQVIFMWFTKIGIGMANAMVLAGLSALTLNPDFFQSNSTVAQQTSTDVAIALFRGHSCVLGNAIDTDGVKSELPSEVQNNMGSNQVRRMVLAPSALDRSYRIAFSTITAIRQNSYICGGVSLTAPKGTDTAASGPLADYSETVAEFSSNYEQTITPIALSALESLEKEVEILAKTYVQNRERIDFRTQVMPLLEAYAKAFDEKLQSDIVAAIPGLEASDIAIKESTQFVNNYGWLMLGSFYPAIATAQSIHANLTTVTIDPIPFGDSRTTFTEVTAQVNKESEAADKTDKGFELSDITNVLGQKVVLWTAKFTMTDFNTGTFNPIMELKDFGDILLGAGSAAILGIATYNGVSSAFVGAADKAGEIAFGAGDILGASTAANAAAHGNKGFFEGLMPFLIMLAVALFFFAFMLSVYIPMLPFITWYGGVIGWFSSIIESLVAAPVGAFIHLDAEGQGMGQRTQHTYLFLMNVLLRPALMVFGFFAASLGVMILGKLLFLLFVPAMASAQTNSWTGVIMILGYIFVFMSLALTMIHGAFNLIHIIPDSVISWAGGHISTKMGQDTDNNTLSSFTKGSSRSDNAASSALNSAGKDKGGPGMPGSGAGIPNRSPGQV